MTWHDLFILETLDRNLWAWNDSSKLQIHPEINIGLPYIRNTSGYIPMLQLHQHSLLTRKVFSRQNLSTQVFFSVSSRSSSSPCHLHLQVISIFKSPSSSSHLHLQVIFIFGSGSSFDLNHHHWIWIITRYGSTSLDLDHYSILIITAGSTSPDLDHHLI